MTSRMHRIWKGWGFRRETVMRWVVVAFGITCLAAISLPSLGLARVMDSIWLKDFRNHVRSLLTPNVMSKDQWYRLQVTRDDPSNTCRVKVCLSNDPASRTLNEANETVMSVVATIRIAVPTSSGSREIVEDKREDPPSNEDVLNEVFRNSRALFNRLQMECVVIRREGNAFYLSKRQTSDEACVARSLAKADSGAYFGDVEDLVMKVFAAKRTRECPMSKDREMVKVRVSSMTNGRGFRVEVTSKPAECRLTRRMSQPSNLTIEVHSTILNDGQKAELKKTISHIVFKQRKISETWFVLAGLPHSLDVLRGLEIYSQLPASFGNYFLVRRVEPSVEHIPDCANAHVRWRSIPETSWRQSQTCLVLEPDTP